MSPFTHCSPPFGHNRSVYAQYGVEGLFKGVIPRMGLNIWQTLFMVTGVVINCDAKYKNL